MVTLIVAIQAFCLGAQCVLIEKDVHKGAAYGLGAAAVALAPIAYLVA